MHGSRSKIHIKKSRLAALRGGFYSGIEVLTILTHYKLHENGANTKAFYYIK
jgi:hypothetical protein